MGAFVQSVLFGELFEAFSLPIAIHLYKHALFYQFLVLDVVCQWNTMGEIESVLISPRLNIALPLNEAETGSSKDVLIGGNFLNL